MKKIDFKGIMACILFIALISCSGILCAEEIPWVAFLKAEQIEEQWGGLDEAQSGANTRAYVEKLVAKETYEKWFPKRYGSSNWCESKQVVVSPGDSYQYGLFLAAVEEVGNLKYKKMYREGTPSCAIYLRLHKPTGKQTLLYAHPQFYSSVNKNKKIIEEVVDLGVFLNTGDIKQDRRELCAFFAHIAHETQQLYYKEEIKYERVGTSRYSSYIGPYRPVRGRSYHGRGPIQITWNYNYGFMSHLIYGDEKVLLQNPQLVADSGKVGYMTSICFWMLPQGNKPSCHQIMKQDWEPTERQKARGITESSFGATILVVHGNGKANRTVKIDQSIAKRVNFYKTFAKDMGLDIQKEKKDTYGLLGF